MHTWPERYELHSKSSRFLKSITSTLMSSFQDPAHNTYSYNGDRGDDGNRGVDHYDSNDEVMSQFSFDTKSSVKKGWFSYALGGGGGGG